VSLKSSLTRLETKSGDKSLFKTTIVMLVPGIINEVTDPQERG
jgi:hypothetical protein